MPILRIAATFEQRTDRFEYEYDGVLLTDVVAARIRSRLQVLCVGETIQKEVVQQLHGLSEDTIAPFQFQSQPDALVQSQPDALDQLSLSIEKTA